jgi:hypothetical protein
MTTTIPVVVPIEDAIDLHAFAPRDVVSVVDEYLARRVWTPGTAVRLIHGRGIGVQRAAVQRLLASHPLVRALLGRARVLPGRDVVVLGDNETRRFVGVSRDGAGHRFE